MKNNPLVSLFGALWHYSVGNKRTVVLFWCMFVLNESVNIVVQPLLTAKILNSIQEHHGVTESNLYTLLGYLGLMLCATLFFWCLHGPGRILERTNAFKARIEYRKFLLSGVMNLPLKWHAEHHSGDTIDKIKEGTGALFDFGGGTFNILYSLTRLLVCFSILAYYSHLAVLVVLSMMLVSTWVTMRFDRVLIPQYRELSRAENRISESVVDATSNISTVIILRVEKVVFNAIVKKLEKPYDLFVTNAKLSECKWFLTNVCCRIMICLSLGVYFWQQSRNHAVFEIGVYYLLLNYLDRVSDLFNRFCDIYGDIVIRRTRVMNSEELSKDFETTSLANHVLPKNWQKLEIKDLSFSYHGKKGDIHLDNISLSLKQGEIIAFIGESGSGKTTFLKAMRDLYHPQKLSLSVDGVVIPDGFELLSYFFNKEALVSLPSYIFKKSAWDPLPMGDGQKLSLRVQSNGKAFRSYNFSFTEPWLGGKKRNALTVSVYNTKYGQTYDPLTGLYDPNLIQNLTNGALKMESRTSTVKPAAITPEDTEIVRQIRDNLTREADLSVDALNAKISSDGGRVTVKGVVRSIDEVNDILRLTWSISGVTDVDNQMKVMAQ